MCTQCLKTTVEAVRPSPLAPRPFALNNHNYSLSTYKRCYGLCRSAHNFGFLLKKTEQNKPRQNVTHILFGKKREFGRVCEGRGRQWHICTSILLTHKIEYMKCMWLNPFFVPSKDLLYATFYILRNSIFNYMRFMATGSSEDFRFLRDTTRTRTRTSTRTTMRTTASFYLYKV